MWSRINYHTLNIMSFIRQKRNHVRDIHVKTPVLFPADGVVVHYPVGEHGLHAVETDEEVAAVEGDEGDGDVCAGVDVVVLLGERGEAVEGEEEGGFGVLAG